MVMVRGMVRGMVSGEYYIGMGMIYKQGWARGVSQSVSHLHGHGQRRPVEVEGHEEHCALCEVDQDHDHRQHHHRQRHHLARQGRAGGRGGRGGL